MGLLQEARYGVGDVRRLGWEVSVLCSGYYNVFPFPFTVRSPCVRRGSCPLYVPGTVVMYSRCGVWVIRGDGAHQMLGLGELEHLMGGVVRTVPLEMTAAYRSRTLTCQTFSGSTMCLLTIKICSHLDMRCLFEGDNGDNHGSPFMFLYSHRPGVSGLLPTKTPLSPRPFNLLPLHHVNWDTRIA